MRKKPSIVEEKWKRRKSEILEERVAKLVGQRKSKKGPVRRAGLAIGL